MSVEKLVESVNSWLEEAKQGRRPVEMGETPLANTLALKPEDLKSVENLGHAMRDQGKFEDARVIFAGLATLTGNTYYAYILGVIASELNDYEEAFYCYSVAIESNPQFADFYVLRALISLKMNNEEAALQDLQRAVESDPKLESPRVKFAKAILDSKNGEPPPEEQQPPSEEEPDTAQGNGVMNGKK
jgi:tetratricopeptide (TPR) repeat protein